MVTHEILSQQIETLTHQVSELQREVEETRALVIGLTKAVNDDIKAFCINVVADVFSSSLTTEEKQQMINRIKL